MRMNLLLLFISPPAGFSNVIYDLPFIFFCDDNVKLGLFSLVHFILFVSSHALFHNRHHQLHHFIKTKPETKQNLLPLENGAFEEFLTVAFCYRKHVPTFSSGRSIITGIKLTVICFHVVVTLAKNINPGYLSFDRKWNNMYMRMLNSFSVFLFTFAPSIFTKSDLKAGT